MIAVIILTIILVIISLKLYINVSIGRTNSHTCLVGKTAIVTGANAGIGLTTSLDLAKRGARVILACRNLDRGEGARKLIVEETNNACVILKQVDLTSLESVRKFANDINENEERLDILINNAGGTMFGNKLTENGLQTLMQTNYFGPFLLTLLLLDKLKKSPSSRIVNVSSIVAYLASVKAKELNKHPYGFTLLSNNVYYARSKLCNILFTMGLAERLKGTRVIVNACHPGVIKSGFLDGFPPGVSHVLKPFIGFFSKNVEEGAQTSIHLATSKDIADQSGYFYMDCKRRNFNACIRKELVEDVWNETEKILADCGFSVKDIVSTGSLYSSSV